MKKEGKKYFLTGLLIVLPALITIYLFISLFAFFDNILGRYISQLTINYLGYRIPGLGLLVFLFLIFMMGFFATNFLGRKIFFYFERLWLRFPIIKKIYPAAKQITKFLFSQKTQSGVQKVVLVEYPRQGVYSLGFVTNSTDKIINDKTEDECLNVLIPIVPNPWTGFLLFVSKQDVIYLDISVEEAIKLIVSGGILNPKDTVESKPSEYFFDEE